MDVQKRIDCILADDRLNDPHSDTTQTEAIELLINECGWELVCNHLMTILRDDSRTAHWAEVTRVFWGAVLDRRSLPADELIAWLYYRIDPEGQAEDNLVWSITSRLRSVGYLSKYQPLKDPAVVRYMQAIRARQQ